MIIGSNGVMPKGRLWVSGAETLRIRTALLRDWRQLFLIDPDLPDEVLLADWPRTRAREIFVVLRAETAPVALEHLRGLMDADVAEHLAIAEPAFGR